MRQPLSSLSLSRSRALALNLSLSLPPSLSLDRDVQIQITFSGLRAHASERRTTLFTLPAAAPVQNAKLASHAHLASYPHLSTRAFKAPPPQSTPTPRHAAPAQQANGEGPTDFPGSRRAYRHGRSTNAALQISRRADPDTPFPSAFSSARLPTASSRERPGALPPG